MTKGIESESWRRTNLLDGDQMVANDCNKELHGAATAS